LPGYLTAWLLGAGFKVKSELLCIFQLLSSKKNDASQLISKFKKFLHFFRVKFCWIKKCGRAAFLASPTHFSSFPVGPVALQSINTFM
jgi:hypothetical protein